MKIIFKVGALLLIYISFLMIYPLLVSNKYGSENYSLRFGSLIIILIILFVVQSILTYISYRLSLNNELSKFLFPNSINLMIFIYILYANFILQNKGWVELIYFFLYLFIIQGIIYLLVYNRKW